MAVIDHFQIRLGLDSLVGHLCSLHVRLRLEHLLNEIKDAQRIELFDLGLIFVVKDHLYVKHIIHQTQEHIELRNDQVKHAQSALTHVLLQ